MENIKVAIIGAGISGIVACKYCLSKGLAPIVFEGGEKLGGVWRNTIESTKLQNTKETFRFCDFPWPSSVKDLHPTHTQVLDYIKSYAQHFRIIPCIKFNSRVISIDYVGESFEEMESWDFWSGTGNPFGSKGKWHIKVQDTKNFSIQEYTAEFVILCIGRFSGLPNIPEFPQNQGPDVFKGKVMHSMEYSALDNLSATKLIKGNRVAVIGSRKSATDIATECSNTNGVEYPCTMVQRNAHWVLPSGFFTRIVLGYLYSSRFSELLAHKPGETFLLSLLATFLSPLRWGISKFVESYLRWKLPLKKYGTLPKFSFDHDVSSCQLAMLPDKFYDKLEEGSIIVKNSQSFSFCENGLIIDGEAQPLETDIVIFATGFRSDEKIKNIFESSVFQGNVKASSSILLYRQILHPRIPKLAIVGYNESLSSLGSSEMKSIWLAKFLDGKIELPCIRDMEKEAKIWGEHMKKAGGRYPKRACINKINIWYNDQLCKDMGYNSTRKGWFLAELFVPYSPIDYAALTN